MYYFNLIGTIIYKLYFILYYFVFNNRYFLIRNLSTYLIFSQMQSEFYFEMRGAFLWVFKWTQLLITLWWLHAYVTYCTLQWDTFVCPKICLKVRAKKKKQTGLILVTTTYKEDANNLQKTHLCRTSEVLF